MKRSNFIEGMKLRERLLLALAVFLMFGTLGPASILSSSVIDPVSWARLTVITIASGGFAAGIVLSLSRTWIFAILVPIFIITIINSGKIASAMSGREERMRSSIEVPATITPEQFDRIRGTRVLTYGLSAMLIAMGWTTFALVMNAESKRRGRMESEMKIAQDIQTSLNPQGPVSLYGFSVQGKTRPTSEVGGDYFDYLDAGDGKLAIVIADVSGHGVGAGIIAAMTKSALYLQVAKDPSPANVMKSLNEALAQITNRKTFVTCAYLLLDRSGRASYSTAGHPPFFVKTGNEVKELRTANLALGVKRGIEFAEAEFKFSAGTVFLLYTDGITDSMNRLGKPFGVEGVRAFMKGSLDHTSLSENLIQTSAQFSGREFKDDATVVEVACT